MNEMMNLGRNQVTSNDDGKNQMKLKFGSPKHAAINGDNDS